MNRNGRMGEKKLTLLLLPGMDGTGALFAEFVKLLPSWIEPLVVSYPRDQRLSYDQLLSIPESALPSNKPFVILAESFSTPLAVRFAAKAPEGLQALVLCAGFVSPPRRHVVRRVALMLAPVLFTFGLPESVCRCLLAGNAAPTSLVGAVCAAVSSVSSGVLAHRLRSVLTCDVQRELRSVSVPLLYLSGLEDRLVRKLSFEEIKETKTDVVLACVEAPHLILQAKPHEAVDIFLRFLRQVRSQSD
jgi:pimeloyl-[acyl-carrier protein] methyl ester esterase